MANQPFPSTDENFTAEAVLADNPFTAAAAVSPLHRFRSTRRAAPKPSMPWTDETGGYALVESGPAPRSEEVELSGVTAVEVAVLWGDTVLDVSHQSPPKSYYVGEEQAGEGWIDYLVPAEQLGATRAPVVLSDETGVSVVIPAMAEGFIEVDGERRTLDEARAQAEPCVEQTGAKQLRLAAGSRARVELGQLAFVVRVVDAGKPTKRGLAGVIDKAAVGYFGLSLAAAAAIVGSMAAFVPPLGLTMDEGPNKDQFYLMQALLNASAEREKELVEDDAADDANHEGGTGERATGEEGAMGKNTSPKTNNHYAIKKTSDAPEQVSRAEAIRQAEEFGMIGLLATMSGDVNAVTSPFGGDIANGPHDVNAVGAMFGDEPGENYGYGGLGLSGIGESGGGRGFGIGLGDIGTIGHGRGLGPGQGFGDSVGRLSGTRKSNGAPKMRPGVTTVSGRLPPEIIQRIVRQNFGRFRMCYENGLRSNPNLEGRVAVRFLIDSTGAVANAGNGGSDLPDTGVVSCVVSAFYGLSFPPPENGTVTVVYPLSLQPG